MNFPFDDSRAKAVRTLLAGVAMCALFSAPAMAQMAAPDGGPPPQERKAPPKQPEGRSAPPADRAAPPPPPATRQVPPPPPQGGAAPPRPAAPPPPPPPQAAPPKPASPPPPPPPGPPATERRMAPPSAPHVEPRPAPQDGPTRIEQKPAPRVVPRGDAPPVAPGGSAPAPRGPGGASTSPANPQGTLPQGAREGTRDGIRRDTAPTTLQPRPPAPGTPPAQNGSQIPPVPGQKGPGGAGQLPPPGGMPGSANRNLPPVPPGGPRPDVRPTGPLVGPPPVVTTPLPSRTAGPRPTFDQLRGERRETQEGGRTIFREGDRTIVRDPMGRSYVRHNEIERFRYGARDIQVRQEGGRTRTVIMRPDGSQIISITGPDGRLFRRIRRDVSGRELILIDAGPRPRPGFFVALPPPIIRIPRERYIVEADAAPPEMIYETLIAEPVERVDRSYSLEEIRYSQNLRARMPSVDLNAINFPSGSWEIDPGEAGKLEAIANGIRRAIERNPREVFLVEGHTDAVGSDVDNLSLSDRRAEAVALVLTEQFGVPAENLVTQGYGEQYLKEQTAGDSHINRRVTVRRITPLLAGGPPPRPLR